jgi:hypothetical protein
MSQQTSSDTVSTTSAASTTSNQTVKIAAPLKLDSRCCFIQFFIIFFRIINLFFLVLRIIRLSQQQHGLRHGDYQRYR